MSAVDQCVHNAVVKLQSQGNNKPMSLDKLVTWLNRRGANTIRIHSKEVSVGALAKAVVGSFEKDESKVALCQALQPFVDAQAEVGEMVGRLVATVEKRFKQLQNFEAMTVLSKFEWLASQTMDKFCMSADDLANELVKRGLATPTGTEGRLEYALTKHVHDEEAPGDGEGDAWSKQLIAQQPKQSALAVLVTGCNCNSHFIGCKGENVIALRKSLKDVCDEMDFPTASTIKVKCKPMAMQTEFETALRSLLQTVAGASPAFECSTTLNVAHHIRRFIGSGGFVIKRLEREHKIRLSIQGHKVVGWPSATALPRLTKKSLAGAVTLLRQTMEDAKQHIEEAIYKATTEGIGKTGGYWREIHKKRKERRRRVAGQNVGPGSHGRLGKGTENEVYLHKQQRANERAKAEHKQKLRDQHKSEKRERLKDRKKHKQEWDHGRGRNQHGGRHKAGETKVDPTTGLDDPSSGEDARIHQGDTEAFDQANQALAFFNPPPAASSSATTPPAAAATAAAQQPPPAAAPASTGPAYGSTA